MGGKRFYWSPFTRGQVKSATVGQKRSFSKTDLNPLGLGCSIKLSSSEVAHAYPSSSLFPQNPLRGPR